jgi:O-succinylbenzoic acid--CoA ligase
MTRAELMTVVRETGCAVECGASVFLCDPGWSKAERALAELQMSEARDRGIRPSGSGPLARLGENGWLCVRTGGSGGGVKFARHDEETLSAAVGGFCAHFGLTRVNAIDVLPAHHVSGLMARVRCAATGGRHRAWDWKRIEGLDLPALDGAAREGTANRGQGTGARGQVTGDRGQGTGGGDGWVISLVPTQLQRLLAVPAAVEWLRGFRVIFLGGGPTWPDLADEAARLGLRVSLSYGMTETAAMVTALRPEEFLAGARSVGAPLPHASVRVAVDGRIAVSGASLFRGYFGSAPRHGEFLTEDGGRIDERGQLHVLGRQDAVIITGGKKVQPAEVEVVLRASGVFADVAVIGVPDPEWGQAVVACYPAGGEPPDVARAVAGLAAHQKPKKFIAVQDWPRTAQGKIDRVALAAAVARGRSDAG